MNKRELLKLAAYGELGARLGGLVEEINEIYEALWEHHRIMPMDLLNRSSYLQVSDDGQASCILERELDDVIANYAEE